MVRVVKKSLGLRHHQKNKESGNFIFNLPTFYHSFPSFSIFRLDFFSFLFFFLVVALFAFRAGLARGGKREQQQQNISSFRCAAAARPLFGGMHRIELDDALENPLYWSVGDGQQP